MTDWVDELASAALDRDDRYQLVLQLSRDTRGEGLDAEVLRSLLAARLRDEPALIQAWQVYSWDKRWSPSPYLDDLEVGLYDSGYRDVEAHSDAVTACAAFIIREVDWLRKRHPAADA